MFFDPAALLPPANSANPANPAPQAVIAKAQTAPAISRFAGLAGETAADGALTISRFAELAATTAANDAPDRHHTWLVTLPTGERFSAMYAPPKTRAEIQARYPGALVEREPDPSPAPPLAPDALEVAYAYLRHIGEQDLKAGTEFIDGLARDPEKLAALYADVVAMGLADWPTAETEPDTDIEDATAPKAVCARCGHWRADSVNAQGGLGTCLIRAPASRRPGSCWPWADAEIRCREFQEVAR